MKHINVVGGRAYAGMSLSTKFLQVRLSSAPAAMMKMGRPSSLLVAIVTPTTTGSDSSKECAMNEVPLSEQPIVVLVSSGVFLTVAEAALYERRNLFGDRILSTLKREFEGDEDIVVSEVIGTDYLEEDCTNAWICSRCGQWASDHQKPDPLPALQIGTTRKDGTFVCEMCRTAEVEERRRQEFQKAREERAKQKDNEPNPPDQ